VSTPISAIIFFSARLQKSKEYALQVSDLLRERIEVDIVDVDQETEKWRQLRLLSVPSIVFFCSDVPISNMVSYSKPEVIINRLDKLYDLSTQPSGGGTLQSIPFYVSGSSGTHRYGRWHEDWLTDDSPFNGWCGPSREGVQDYLVLSPLQPSAVKVIQIFPRERVDGTDSWKSFPKSLSVSDLNGNVAWSAKDLHSHGGVFEIQLPLALEDSEIKLTIMEKHDIDGKAFPSLRRIVLLGEIKGIPKQRPRIKRSVLRETGSESSYIKFGLHASPKIQVEEFSFFPAQRLPVSISPFERVLYLVSGSAIFTIDGDDHCLSSLDSVIIPPNQSVAILAVDATRVIVAHAGSDNPTLWEAR